MQSSLFASEYRNLIGAAAPEWKNDVWLNTDEPLRMPELQGKVILIRFFTGTTCPFCSATAPALNEFHEAYASRGLVVIGMYTPKPSPAKVPVDNVRRIIDSYGFRFPVALDNDWATLNAYWLHRIQHPDFTSVSFLIDRKGKIRHIHPGGEYSASSSNADSREDYRVMKQMIEQLLSE